MPPMSAGKHDLLDLYEWCAEFNEAREPIQGYNQAYIRPLTDYKGDTDDITLFTDADEDLGQMPNLEANTILDFCRNVRTLDAFNKSPSKKLVAVVHESDSTGRTRGSNRPLTATQLHETLLIPHGTMHGGNGTESPSNNNSTENIPNAERRLVFVVNLDESAVWALATTASPIEVRAIRSFISDHIEWKASLNVNIPIKLPRTFEMSFHLPFYVIRDSSKGGPFHDISKLRHSPSIDFMRETFQADTGPSLSEYLYQVEASCLVTGQDSHIWSAYTIIDSCSEYEDGGVLEDYQSQKDEMGSLHDMLDPVTGKPLAWPSMTPRELFLGVLHVRSEQAGREWCNTVSRILARYHSVKNSFDKNLALSWAATEGYDHRKDVRDREKAYFLWAISVTKLLEMLKDCLDECTCAWDMFTAGDLRYFFAPGKDYDMTPTQNHRMVAITKSFNQMAMLSRKLHTVNVGLKNTMNELGHHLAYENNESAILQMATAKDVKILTWVTFHSLPFMLVAGFMSTREEILPLPETPATLIVSLVVIEAVLWIMLDRFANGKYIAIVRGTVDACFHWVRCAIHCKDNSESSEPA
ncbi:uncharacterized protein PG986_014540 [Apiospora aurea]|uniref:Uncharacterized protein n=1 Tax=Apiospora aurea TaxID=335848 RepID=A0ABR1PT98_9PEZI